MPLPQALHLYPSALARDAALEALGSCCWTDGHLTFSEFVNALDRQLPRACTTPLNIIDEDARQILLLRARAGLGNEQRERLGHSEAALISAAALIAAWKGAGLQAEQLGLLAQRLKNSALTETFGLLYELWCAYERLIPAQWADREGYEQQVLARLVKCCRLPVRVLPPGGAVELHGFHRLVPFQRRLLEGLQQLGHAVKTALPGPLSQTLTKSWGVLQVSQLPVEGCAPKAHGRIQAPTPYAEIYEIARRVHGWITSDKVAPARICVALRDLGPYSQAVHDVFRRFKIPFYERRGEPLAFQPVVRVALSGIEACVAGLTRESLFRFLSSGPVSVARLAGASAELEAGALQRLARAARIDRFFGEEAAQPARAWKQRIERYLTSQSSQRELQARAAALLKIVNVLDQLRAPRTLAEHAQAWRKLFDNAGLSALSLAPEAGADFSKDQAALAQLDHTLAGLASSVVASQTLTLEEFLAIVALAIKQQSVRSEGDEPAGVRVLNLYDLRGLNFTHLVLAGMAEGVLPAPPAAHPLIGLASAGVVRGALLHELKDEPWAHVEPRLAVEFDAEERALFQIACRAAAGGLLVFTRPLQDDAGCPLGPSLFWNHFASQFAAEPEKALPIHPAPPLAQCLSAEERELRTAWLLGGGIDAVKDPEAERRAAAALYLHSPRLQQAAERARVEQARQRFFAQVLPDAESGQPAQVPGPYDGWVQCAEAPARLKRLLLHDPQSPGRAGLSPGSLETLANCRFHFLNKHVFRFNEVQDPDLELSPLDTGQVWHDILSRFYLEELTARASLVVALEPSRAREYLQRLERIATRVLEQAPARYFTGHPGFWRFTREKIQATLRRWLEQELKSSGPDAFCPAGVEFEFGAGKLLSPVILPVPDGQLALSGRLDRVDLQLDDPHAATPTIKAVRIIDYKLGGADRHRDRVKPQAMQELLAVQLPVYLMVAFRFIERLEQAGRVRVAREELYARSQAGYYCLRDVTAKDFGVLLITSWPLNNMQKFLCEQSPGTLAHALSSKLEPVLRGDFAVYPRECAGLNCPARYGCRYQDVPGEREGGEGRGGLA